MRTLLCSSLFLLLLAGSLATGRASTRRDEGNDMAKEFQSFELGDLIERGEAAGDPWLEFLDNRTTRAGVYRLAKGSEDRQSPHELDELYYVVSGRARFRAGETVTPVKAGSILFVAAKVEHRFLDIEEDLTVLVFFSKAKPTSGHEKGDEDAPSSAS